MAEYETNTIIRRSVSKPAPSIIIKKKITLKKENDEADSTKEPSPPLIASPIVELPIPESQPKPHIKKTLRKKTPTLPVDSDVKINRELSPEVPIQTPESLPISETQPKPHTKKPLRKKTPTVPVDSEVKINPEPAPEVPVKPPVQTPESHPIPEAHPTPQIKKTHHKKTHEASPTPKAPHKETKIDPPSGVSKHRHKKHEPDTKSTPVVKKTVVVVKSVITDFDQIPQIDGSEMLPQYTNVKNKTELSKEEMVENVEFQRDVLVKNRNKYSDKDYALKLESIEKLLSKLRLDMAHTNLNQMTETRVKIDKIVLDKKIPEPQFKSKIDLTGERDDKDPSMSVMTDSRKYFKKMTYLPVPMELKKLDPQNEKNKGKGFGNKPLPPELATLVI